MHASVELVVRHHAVLVEAFGILSEFWGSLRVDRGYSSSLGLGVAGVGWDIGIPFIARQTDRGVPK